MLVLTLYWLRLYHTYDQIAEQYNINHTTLQSMFTEVVTILDTTLVPAFIVPLSDTDPASPSSTLCNAYLVIDSTFVPTPRPVTADERRALFHPKSPTKFALKVQISCSINNLIVHVSDVVKGSMHDKTLLDTTNVLSQLKPDQVAIGDVGYAGKENVKVPLRRTSKALTAYRTQHYYTRLKRAQRHELQTQRSVIERINRRIKCWSIVSTIYRGCRHDLTDISAIVRVVCALCNMCTVLEINS